VEGARADLAIQVGRAEAVVGGLELGMRLARAIERVELGDQVPAHAVAADQLVGAILDVGRAGFGRELAAAARRRIEDAARAEAGLQRRRPGEIAPAVLVEVGAPVRRDGARIAQIVGIEPLDEAEARGVLPGCVHAAGEESAGG
jgi:hypothetical protein